MRSGVYCDYPGCQEMLEVEHKGYTDQQSKMGEAMRLEGWISVDIEETTGYKQKDFCPEHAISHDKQRQTVDGKRDGSGQSTTTA